MVRDFVLSHRFDSLVDNVAAIKEQKSVDVSKSWLAYLAKTDPDRLHVRLLLPLSPSLVSHCFARGCLVVQPFHTQPKPELTEEHKEARVEFCIKHHDTHWSVWVWTDEFTIYPRGKKGQRGRLALSSLLTRVLCRRNLLGAAQG